MVSVSVFQPLPGNRVDLLAAATARARGEIKVEGPRPDLVDTSRPMYSVRTRKFVKYEKDHEEWLRSFAESFRSAQVVAVVTKDTVHKELVASGEILSQLDTAQLATR